jgi:Fe-S cluster assembly ATPase SufC
MRIQTKQEAQVEDDLANSGDEEPGVDSGDNVKATSDGIFIAVMGSTGSGKSSFVKTLTGAADVVVGEDLTSCSYSKFHLLDVVSSGWQADKLLRHSRSLRIHPHS